MKRTLPALIGFSSSPTLLVCDLALLKEKLRVAKHRKTLARTEDLSRVGVSRSEDLSDEDIARGLGMREESGDQVDVQELRKRKALMVEMVNYQQLRRQLSRNAFLEWQSGQREKGSGDRLKRMTGKAERNKRLHNQHAEGRLLSVTYHSSEGDNTSNDWNPHIKSLEFTQRELRNGNRLRIRIGSPGGRPL